MTVSVRTNPKLLEHLRQWEHDGATVDSLLFEGGRLSYPGRKEIEYQLGYTEPYTIELEARIVEGISPRFAAAVRMLANNVKLCEELDPTLELLWSAHSSWSANGISLDRLVAALVMIQIMQDGERDNHLSAIEACQNVDLNRAAVILVKGLHSFGLPPTQLGLEELFDGAPPACVGLGLVDL